MCSWQGGEVLGISNYQKVIIMPDIETLRMFVNQRLTAAAEEILAVFGRTIVQFQQEIDLQRRQMAILNVNPEIKCHCQVSGSFVD